ncbi:recombinase family protein [Microbacterium sp. NPDC087589]|uniref:recombinase family protein n=1 Tax=Microbacterium sp. NPDC087589 TaxID=3364191 RepID=UPI00382FCDD3
MRVGIYVRQSVTEDDGIEQQKAECQAEIERRRAQAARDAKPGKEPESWEIVETYPDNQTSASKDRGEGTAWARMLADIDAGRIDCIVVVAVDRLMRRLVDVLEIRPPRRDVRVIVVRGGIDTDDTSGVGQFILGLFVLVAEQENRTKTRRAIPYRENRNAQGHPSPGKVPYGYRWRTEGERANDDTRCGDTARERVRNAPRYAVSEAEEPAIRFVFSEVIGGSPLGMIARELNNGTARDPESRALLAESTRTTRSGAAWSATTVRRIALSPYYAALLPGIVPGAGNYRAELVDLDACTPGIWKAIVEVDEVRAARGLLIDPKRRKHQGTSRRWMLSGLAVCDVCGARVRSARTKERYQGYRCPKGHFQRSGAILDQYAEQVVIERLSRPDAASLVQPSRGVDLDALRAREGALRGRRAVLLDLAASGTYDAAEVRDKVAPIDAELAEVTATIGAALAVDPFAAVVSADDVQSAWDALTLARKRRIVSELFVMIIRPVGKGVRVTTLEHAARTVDVVWRRPGRAHVALPSLVNEAEVSRELGSYTPLSEGMRAALAHSLDG